MMTDVIKKIEKEDLEKYIQAKRKEMFSELKSKQIDKKR